MASGRALAACLCVSSSVVLARCERVVSVDFEDAEVEQHVQQDLVRRENQSQKGINLAPKLLEILKSLLPVGSPDSVAPLHIDEAMTGYPGSIDITQDTEPVVGCAATYQDEEGYATGIVISNVVLDIDVKFNGFDLRSLLEGKPYLRPVSSFLVLDGMLKARITIPLQRIGFRLDEVMNWEAYMDEEDVKHIDVVATDFIPKTFAAAFTKEIPGWMPGFEGKPQNFLDWVTKTPKIGLWPMIARKVTMKIDEKAHIGALGTTLGLHVMNNFVTRRFFAAASYVGIGNTYCTTLSEPESYRGGQSPMEQGGAAAAEG